jgi:2-dehydro-3-deoxyphosphogluconate aldolase/(4S)-4-hydroxy-2-oxoglutarate aldolase
MTSFDRLHIYLTIRQQGLIPLFYHRDGAVANQIARAVYAGGARLLEFTNRGTFALEAFTHLIKETRSACPDLIIGVGSIEDAPTAALFLAHGANFVVAPNFNAEIAKLCNRRKIAYIPGCATVTEIATAEEHGAEIVKLFPGNSVGGAAFVKGVLAPRPWTSILPTGGVTTDEANLREWFNAGVVAVGIGGQLIKEDLVTAGQFEGLASLTAQTRATIDKVRGITSE